MLSLETIGVVSLMLDDDPHIAEQMDEVVHVQDIRDVLDDNLIGCQQGCTDDFQLFVFSSLWYDFTVQAVVSFYDK